MTASTPQLTAGITSVFSHLVPAVSRAAPWLVRVYIPSLLRVSLSSWPVTFKPSAFW